MISLILASGNAHKAQEFAELFDPNFFSVKAAPEKLEVEEHGESFYANAFLKAESYYRRFKIPVLSDDSGLTVEALPGELGIHSARFGGEGLSDRERAELLLKKMESQTNRKAYFTCVLCFYLTEKEVFYFEGRMNGSIGYRYQGAGGFGYDPVFIPEGFADQGLTVAELSEWKQKNSHRALAVLGASKFLASRIS